MDRALVILDGSERGGILTALVEAPALSPGETLFYTLRHGLTELNRSKRTGGRLDLPLLEEGRRQAEEARANFEGTHLDVVISSPLRRAVETAEIVTGWPRERVLIDDLAVERSFGEMEGLTQEEIGVRFPLVMYLPIGHIRYSLNPPGGESYEALRARARAFLERMLASHYGKRVLLSSHQNFMQQVHGELRGLDPYASLADDILNLELNQFHLDADGRLLGQGEYQLCPDASKYPSF